SEYITRLLHDALPILLDMPGVALNGEQAIFTRTLQLSASEKPLTIVAASESPQVNIAVQGTDAQVKSEGGRLFVTFPPRKAQTRSEEHTSELQSRVDL